MIGQNQFDNVSPQALNLGGLGEDVHPRRQGSVAGSDDAGRASDLQRHFDGADATRAVRFQLGRITKCRHMAASAMAVNEIEQRVAGEV